MVSNKGIVRDTPILARRDGIYRQIVTTSRTQGGIESNSPSLCLETAQSDIMYTGMDS